MSAILDNVTVAKRETAARVRPFFWSVSREIWENRFIYIAPLAVALVVLTAFTIGTVHLPHILQSNHTVCKPGPCAPPPDGLPFSIAAIAVMLTGILVGIIYCLGALYNERRDRSILFWKSLPVSDLVTVLSKASIPLIVIPAIIFAVTLVLQLIMQATGGVIVVFDGESLPAFWRAWPFFRMACVLLYGLVTLALWHAPLYAWLLMVSAWARRVPFLWAVLPPLGLGLAEKIAFDTSFFGNMLADREFGSFNAAFNGLSGSQITSIQWDQLAPVQFLETPELWFGLAFAIVFLGVASRLRRGRAAL
jgi:ABC-2 type transport system permease protein